MGVKTNCISLLHGNRNEHHNTEMKIWRHVNNKNPIKIQGLTRSLMICKQFLLQLCHPSCYSCKSDMQFVFTPIGFVMGSCFICVICTSGTAYTSGMCGGSCCSIFSVSSSCSNCVTRRVTHVKNPIMRHERGKNRIVATANAIYQW
jgi:hypothetical protein